MEEAIRQVEFHIDDPDLGTVLRHLEQNKDVLVQPTRDFVQPQESNPNEHNRIQPETLTKTQLFTLKNGSSVSLTFYARITPLDATVSTLKVQLYLLTGVLVGIAIVTGGLIAKRVSKPIEDINRSAKVLAKGNYDVTFQGRGFLEIRELSDTLNHAAEELSKVDGLRKELMANISHDLRTPLSLIYSYGELMHDFPQEITREQTQVIMEETKRLSDLVNEIMDLSQLESGMAENNPSMYCFTESIAQVVRSTGELVRKVGIEIQFHWDQEVRVLADKHRMTQVVYNFLTNAIHYGGSGKKIFVRQMVSNGIVRIEVEDQGLGIPEENLPYIWDRYYRVDKEHKRAATGTGLGLSIAKNVLERQGANYGVVSKVGEGSIFWFELPTL